MEIDYSDWKDPNSELRIEARKIPRWQKRLNWIQKMNYLHSIHAEIESQKPKTETAVA
jgi:hypothetical protein